MSQSFNLINNYNNQENKLSTSMMTFNKYHMTFIRNNKQHLENGWGWFVDVDLNTEPVRIVQNNITYKSSQNRSLLKTIQEYPSIRSMKSMKNLNDTSMMFEFDEYDNNHRTNNNISNINVTIIRITQWYLYFMSFINITNSYKFFISRLNEKFSPLRSTTLPNESNSLIYNFCECVGP